MPLYTNDGSIWEIVEVNDSVDPIKLAFDKAGNLVDDLEKANLNYQLGVLAELLMDKEFYELVKEIEDENI